MLDTELRPLPSLAPSFALFGAMAGFFALLALGAFHDGCRSLSPWVAAGSAAVAGAGLGALLRRYGALRNPMAARETVWLRLGGLLLVAGGLAGLGTGAVSIALVSNGLSTGTIAASGVLGALIGVSLLPACAVVYDAAKRAARARPGSVVSGADRARVGVALFTTMSFFALAAVPAILLEEYSRFLEPVLQMALTALAPVACLAGAVIADLVTHRWERHCEALARKREQCAPAEARDATSTRVADLGLGDEHWSEVRLQHAYRGARNANVVLRGNIDDARYAIRETRASGRASMLVAMGMSGLIGAASALSPMLRRHEVPLNDAEASSTFAAAPTPRWIIQPSRANARFEARTPRPDDRWARPIRHSSLALRHRPSIDEDILATMAE